MAILLIIGDDIRTTLARKKATNTNWAYILNEAKECLSFKERSSGIYACKLAARFYLLVISFADIKIKETKRIDDTKK